MWMYVNIVLYEGKAWFLQDGEAVSQNILRQTERERESKEMKTSSDLKKKRRLRAEHEMEKMWEQEVGGSMCVRACLTVCGIETPSSSTSPPHTHSTYIYCMHTDRQQILRGSEWVQKWLEEQQQIFIILMYGCFEH